MASIKTSISLVDKFTPVMKRINESINEATRNAGSMNSAASDSFESVRKNIERVRTAAGNLNKTGFSGTARSLVTVVNNAKGLNTTLSNVNRTVGGTNTTINKTISLTQRLRRAAADVRNDFSKMTSTLSGIGSQIFSIGANLGGWIFSIKNATSGLTDLFYVLDDINNTKARANILSEQFGMSGDELRATTNVAARSVGQNGPQMMEGLAKMGIMTDGVFDNFDELLAFNLQLQKMYRIAGAGQAQVESANLQLTQALAAGTLRGEEFNAVFEAAPSIIQTVAKYMGVTTGEMKNLASEGVITSEIIKNALLSATDDTNATFAQMPYTFSGVMNLIKGEILSSLDTLSDSMGSVWTYVVENWERVLAVAKPIITVIAILTGIIGTLAVAIGVVTAATWLWNFALALNPATWVAVAIIALIMVLIALAGYLVYVYNANMEFRHGFLSAWTDILNWFTQVPSFFLGIGDGMLTVFENAGSAIVSTMENTLNKVIGLVNNAIGLINNIPGVNIGTIGKVSIADTVKSRVATKQSQRDAILANERAKAQNKIDTRNSNLASRIEQDKLNAANKNNKSSLESLMDRLNGLGTTAPGIDQLGSYGALQDVLNKGAGGGAGGKGSKINGGKLDSIGRIDDSLELSDETIRMLKDVATMRVTHNYTKLEPNLSVTFGDIHEKADVNEILQAVEDMVEQAYATALVK